MSWAKPTFADLIDFEFKRRDNAEVRSRASNCPEEIAIFLVAGTHNRTISQDDLDRPEMIDGESMLANQPADASGGSETANADSAVIAGAQCPSIWFERSGGHPSSARGSDAHAASRTVEHLNAIHVGETDDNTAIVGGTPADAVAGAAN